MFCPKCSAYLSEREIVKTSVKYAPGNVPIEYEARCPHCRVEMGTVSWGQLTVDPALAAELAAAPSQKTEAGSDSGADTAPSTVGEPQNLPPDSEGGKICPHCGKPLPKDY